MNQRFRIYTRVTNILYLLIGTMLSATAGAVFYTPARITGGGATGIGTIFYYLFGLDQGNVMLCVNIPLVLFGMKVFGWKYGIRTLIGSVMLSIWTTIFGHLTGYQGFLDYSDNVNVLLSALFGGVLMGIGIGLTMKSGSNTGGTDIISQVVSHYFPVRVGTVSFSVNALVVSCGGIFLGLQPMLFAIIAMYLSAQLTNFVFMGFGTNMSKAVYILTDSEKIPSISRAVTSRLHRSGTVFEGEGLYTLKARYMLVVIVPNNQLKALLAIVNHEDASAFVFVTEAYEVLGRGFMPIKKALRDD